MERLRNTGSLYRSRYFILVEMFCANQLLQNRSFCLSGIPINQLTLTREKCTVMDTGFFVDPDPDFKTPDPDDGSVC